MSRGQQQQVFSSAGSQNSTNFNNAQSAFGSAENAVGNYDNQLAKFVASNPYTAGSEYDKDITTGLANVSDAGSNSLKGALQSQALRTGQNSAAANATAASAAQQNTRDLSANLASAEQQRIGNEASYNQQALNASQVPISAQSSLYGTSSGAANSELGTEESAAQTPSFWDEVGGGLANGLGGALGGTSYSTGNWRFGGGKGCWIAAEIYGGWSEPRTVLVREWLHGSFSKHRLGRVVVRLYMRLGERTAVLIRRWPLLRRPFLAIFDQALKRARRETIHGRFD
jgi:hypothetical protein